jgi:glucosamine-6-phosphate deaminase
MEEFRMNSIYDCSPEELMAKSRIPICVQSDEQTICEEIANIMVGTILKNSGKRSVFICPVGPVNQYKIFVNMVNELRIDLKNVWFFNMDEYLDEHDQMISPDDPLSFVGFMQKNVYSKIDPALIMPQEQRLFPMPGKADICGKMLRDFGGADVCLTGVGINGHIAFNEPPEQGETMTDEQFKHLPTRCLDLQYVTIVNNGLRKVAGALELMPKRCITLGMDSLLAAHKFKIYLYCDWQWGIMRKIALNQPTFEVPASFLQLHPDSEMVVTSALFEKAHL